MQQNNVLENMRTQHLHILAIRALYLYTLSWELIIVQICHIWHLEGYKQHHPTSLYPGWKHKVQQNNVLENIRTQHLCILTIRALSLYTLSRERIIVQFSPFYLFEGFSNIHHHLYIQVVNVSMSTFGDMQLRRF